MHILFLSDNFPPETNAPATRTFEHAREWVRLGHSVTVVTCAPNFPEGRVFDGYANRWYARESVEGIDVVRVVSYVAANRGFGRRTLDYLSFLVTGTLGGLLQRRPDVVVATSPQFFAACAGWLVAACKRRPFVFELRDLWPASICAVGAMRKGLSIRLLERLELALYRRAAAVVAVSDAFRRDLAVRGIPAGKVHVVTGGVDLARYRPIPKDEPLARELGLEGLFVVGYLGTHGMAHALERVLDAAELLRHRPEVRFLFAGSGAARDALIASAEHRGLPNVVFLPSQPKERMASLWSLCDLALIHLKDTPVFETVIPSKLFEAMGTGVPTLLAAPEGEASAIVRRTACGTCVPPEDPAALARAVESLLDDPSARKRLAAAATAAAPLFDRATLARSMLSILERTAAAALPAAGPRTSREKCDATPAVEHGMPCAPGPLPARKGPHADRREPVSS